LVLQCRPQGLETKERWGLEFPGRNTLHLLGGMPKNVCNMLRGWGGGGVAFQRQIEEDPLSYVGPLKGGDEEKSSRAGGGGNIKKKAEPAKTMSLDNLAGS